MISLFKNGVRSDLFFQLNQSDNDGNFCVAVSLWIRIEMSRVLSTAIPPTDEAQAIYTVGR